MVHADQGLKSALPLYWCAKFVSGHATLWVRGKPAPEVTAADLLEDESKREAARERRERHALGEYSDEDSDDHA